MKTTMTAAMLLATIMILTGCTSPQRGDAYGHEQEFRRQLAESVPVREHGYEIKDLRFSPDYKKALVLFTHTDTKARPDSEVILQADDFGRYTGGFRQPEITSVLTQPDILRFNIPQLIFITVTPRSK